MARQRHLKKAPITEALIDFRVALSPEFDTEAFLNIGEEISDLYPQKNPIRLSEFSFGVEEGKPIMKSPIDIGIRGYIYKSVDGKNVAQFRIDGFTFSRLSPYTEWEKVYSEAIHLWELYCSKSSPYMINRIAVRYINRLDLPASSVNFSEYLKAPPKLPRSLPQKISQFLTRIVIHEEDITANIIQALGKSPKPEYIGVILDIDVFKENEAGFNKESFLSQFNQLRILKNRIFFSSITEKMARLCE